MFVCLRVTVCVCECVCVYWLIRYMEKEGRRQSARTHTISHLLFNTSSSFPQSFSLYMSFLYLVFSCPHQPIFSIIFNCMYHSVVAPFYHILSYSCPFTLSLAVYVCLCVCECVYLCVCVHVCVRFSLYFFLSTSYTSHQYRPT